MQPSEVPKRFPEDDFHELRGLQYELRKETLRVLAMIVVERYRTAWRIVGRPEDRLLEKLDACRWFDTNSLLDVHEMLAAYWRKKHGLTQPTLPQVMNVSDLLSDWQLWLYEEVRAWALWEPRLIRGFCKVLADQHDGGDMLSMFDLGEEIARLYSLRALDNPDFAIIHRRPDWKGKSEDGFE